MLHNFLPSLCTSSKSLDWGLPAAFTSDSSGELSRKVTVRSFRFDLRQPSARALTPGRQSKGVHNRPRPSLNSETYKQPQTSKFAVAHAMRFAYMSTDVELVSDTEVPLMPVGHQNQRQPDFITAVFNPRNSWLSRLAAS